MDELAIKPADVFKGRPDSLRFSKPGLTSLIRVAVLFFMQRSTAWIPPLRPKKNDLFSNPGEIASCLPSVFEGGGESGFGAGGGILPERKTPPRAIPPGAA